MFNVGDTVRFHAETEDWTERLDGVLAEVTEVEVAGPDGEVLYVDLVFQDGEMLDAVCVTHLEPIDRKVRVLAARAA
jgi:hypothetical protein